MGDDITVPADLGAVGLIKFADLDAFVEEVAGETVVQVSESTSSP